MLDLRKWVALLLIRIVTIIGKLYELTSIPCVNFILTIWPIYAVVTLVFSLARKENDGKTIKEYAKYLAEDNRRNLLIYLSLSIILLTLCAFGIDVPLIMGIAMREIKTFIKYTIKF